MSKGTSCARRLRGGWLVMVVVAAGIIQAGGCASRGKRAAPPPPIPPEVTASVQYRPDVVATTGPMGPTTTKLTATTAGADPPFSVEAEWHALSAIPPGLPSLLSRARLIEAPDAADPLLATGRLTRDARIVPPEKLDAILASADNAGRVRRAAIAASRGVLPRGATSAFAIEPTAAAADDNSMAPPPRPRLEVAIRRIADSTATTRPGAGTAPSTNAEQVQLALNVLKPRRATDASAQHGEERVLLDPMPLTLPMRVAIVVPAQLNAQTKAVLAVLHIAPAAADDAEYRQALAQCETELSRYRGALARSPATTGPATRDWRSMEAALNLLGAPSTTRAALVHLAGETDARLCGDVALAADDPTLVELARRIRTHVDATPPPERDVPRLAWLLEASCLEQLTAMQTSEKLPPELAAVLTLFAGEAGRRPASLDQLARAGSVDALRARLVAENFTYLEDASPAARVRAFDWLGANGRAPAGYDPLGDAKRRRAALDQAMTAAAKSSGGVP